MRLLLLTGICLLVSASVPASDLPLTEPEVTTALVIRQRADVLRLEALQKAIQQKPDEEESFEEILEKVQRIGLEADRQACEEHGVDVERYRTHLHRLIVVGEYLMLKDVQHRLHVDLARHRAKTDEDLAREADETLDAAEQWRNGLPADVIPGYRDSVDQIVVDPIRRQAADGTLVESVRSANENRIAEIESTLAELDAKLSTPAMRQAAVDQPIVSTLADRQTLQQLSGSLVEEIPSSAHNRH